jgi:hypothetical protein
MEKYPRVQDTCKGEDIVRTMEKFIEDRIKSLSITKWGHTM